MAHGEFVGVRTFIANKKTKKDIDEASDTYDAIDWLVKNIPFNNGNEGVFGISYPGFYSTMAALSGHPALKAVSPQAPVTEWFLGDDFHHNGAFMLMDAFSFYSGFGKPSPAPTTIGSRGFDFPILDNYKFYLETGPIKNFTKLMGDSIKFWNDLITHLNYDDWWKARDARRACYNIKPAMLVVGGTFDAEDCYGAWNLYKAIEQQSKNTNNKIVMGPWFHGGWGRGTGSYLGNVRFGSHTSEYYQQKIEIPFFEYYLRGKGDAANIAEASVFFTGSNVELLELRVHGGLEELGLALEAVKKCSLRNSGSMADLRGRRAEATFEEHGPGGVDEGLVLDGDGARHRRDNESRLNNSDRRLGGVGEERRNARSGWAESRGVGVIVGRL